MSHNSINGHEDDRREFLRACGKFAVTVPPAMTILLSTSLTSEAIAASTGGISNGGNQGGSGANSSTGVDRGGDHVEHSGLVDVPRPNSDLVRAGVDKGGDKIGDKRLRGG